MKITGDYGFYEHSKFIAKNKTEFEKFEKHLTKATLSYHFLNLVKIFCKK
jgi:hypothetical protein